MIYILYGSQSGNCEEISKMLYEVLKCENKHVADNRYNFSLHPPHLF
jgi:flavodoxin